MLAGGALARSGNRLTAKVAPHVRAGTAYDVTVRGVARRRAHVYLYVDYNPCAGSAAAERLRLGSNGYVYAVKGSFAEVSGWRSSGPGIDHVCAYLVADGHLLARARVSFRIH
jgi:hypothetical protein